MVVRLPLFFVRLQQPENLLLRPLLFQFSLYDIALYLASVAYFVLMTYYTGATVGKRLMNLSVVSMDETPLSLFSVIYRETIGRYLSSILFIGYLMIGASEQRRGLHDILSGTKVIYTCKCRPVSYGKAALSGGGEVAGFTPYQPYQPMPVQPASPFQPAEPEAVPPLPETEEEVNPDIES